MKGSPVRSTPEQVVSRRPALLISAAARTERGMKGGGLRTCCTGHVSMPSGQRNHFEGKTAFILGIYRPHPVTCFPPR